MRGEALQDYVERVFGEAAAMYVHAWRISLFEEDWAQRYAMRFNILLFHAGIIWLAMLLVKALMILGVL